MKQLKKCGQLGFTIPEIMLTISVLAILVTMTTPGLIGFLKSKDIRNEQNDQLAIKAAITAMIQATGNLPLDTATGTAAWYNALAKYANLSPSRIQLDQWNNARSYVMLKNQQTLLNSPVPIFYVSIISKGPDAKATAQVDNVSATIAPISGVSFAASTVTSWWKFATDPVAEFSALGVPSGSDDIMTRMTDYPDKVAAYNTTLDRLNKITDALSSYANARYAERVVACNSSSPPADCATKPPESQVHVPWGYDGGAGYIVSDSATIYNGAVLTATQSQNGNTTNYFYNGAAAAATGTDTSRRLAMINLVRLLGLPDDYCCSALDQFTDSNGVAQQMPFYYFSNPRPRNSGVPYCGTRPGFVDSKLPPRVTTAPIVPDNTSGATCG